MNIDIARFRERDIDTVFDIQRKAYKPLYEKYQDGDSNPYMESKETVLYKYTRAGTVGYIFMLENTPVGAVRIVIDAVKKRAKSPPCASCRNIRAGESPKMRCCR